LKNRIHKILGVGITLVIAMALVMGFAAPVAASPAETINEWYKFEYPVPGADGDWLYDPYTWRIGEITEATDGTLYVHVQRTLDSDPLTSWPDDFTFNISTGTLTITEFGTSDTGIVTADLDGTWNGPERDFTACLDWAISPYSGTAVVNGTLTAANCSFTGSIEDIGGDISALAGMSPHTIIGGGFDIDSMGFMISDLPGDVTFSGITNISSHIFKSTDGARTWEDTGFPGGWVADMAASSLDADILYVTDGIYVYKTDDAGDSWNYVGKDSLETALSGYCGAPPTCCYCIDSYCSVCPACPDFLSVMATCPITSIDVTYNDNEDPYVYIGTRAHCSGLDLDEDVDFDEFPGDVLYIGEAGYPANWTSLNLPCYGGGDYDALAVGCAPDWADSKETYVVVSNDSETHVVYTKGTICGWYEFAELFFDCDSVTPNDFSSIFASRIAFPDDWEDVEALFVGVVDCDYCEHTGTPPFLGGPGGDVYMAMQDSAIDMNVMGITSGCVGIKPVDIISLDIEGDTDEAQLIAGSFCCNEVYYSYDGGWSWDASAKDPTGGGLFVDGPTLTYAIWYEDTALAVTSGCECAVSLSCVSDDVEDVGEAWTQISLINTDIDEVRWIDHSPGYVCGDSETMFMLTNDDVNGPPCYIPCQEHCLYDETQSVWRHDGTYWERVYSSTIAGANACCGNGPAGCTEAENIFWRLQVSPDFNDTNAVYLWDGCFEMWRTTDAGCSWDKLTFPCAPRPCIREAVVIDEDTVIAGGWHSHACCTAALGKVYKTTRHGARPWAEYEYETVAPGGVISFDLEAGYEDPGWVLLGDDDSRVYISEDGGEEWDLVGAGTTTGCQAVLDAGEEDTFVAFDPDYATNDTIYAAAGSVIARCTIDPDVTWAKQEWAVLCAHDVTNGGDLEAAGIKAVGDTVLYVTDRQSTDDDECSGPGNGEPTCLPCEEDGIPDEGGVLRSLNPLDDVTPTNKVIFERIANGLPLTTVTVPPDKAQLRGLWLTCDTSEGGCAENVLWSLEQMWADSENIWVYEDTLAQPVVLAMPVEGTKLTTTDKVTLSWNELCGAECYEVSLWKYCAECPDEKMAVDLDMDCAPGECCMVCGPAAALDVCACPAGECPCTTDICIVVDGLESGTNYYWQVRVCQCQPVLSKWSEERSFSTALLGVPFIDLCSPACGSQDIILTPNFAWGPVTGATGYDIELATTETFTAGVVRGSSTVNAWVLTEPLDYSTTYYWRVRAEKDGIFSGWTVCMFTTMAKPVAPTAPVTVEQVPPPQITVEVPVQQIAPNWIYAIIGIGAALVVVVIVLIARTRRPTA